MLQPIHRIGPQLLQPARTPNTHRTKLTRPAESTALTQDTVQFGNRKLLATRRDTPVYQPALAIGEYGVPAGHPHEACFKADRATPNLPGVARVERIRSLDPDEQDPTKAHASEMILDVRGTRLAYHTTPGEHISFFDTSDAGKFSPAFLQKLRQAGPKTRLSPEELLLLKDTRVKNFTIASPLGGERNWRRLPNGRIKLIIRRVETAKGYKGPLTNFLVSRKPGDGLVFAAPISHHFLGPKANTPALFLGIGSSVSPYIGMLRTRFEQEKGPYAETYLGIGHTRQALEYERKRFNRFAHKSRNHFTYRPVFSREPEKSNNAAHVQDLLRKPEEAQNIFRLILNPRSQIYISGFWGFDEQIQKALLQSALDHPQLGVTPVELKAAIEAAKLENRYHVEGEIRQDLAEGLQGY